MAIMRDGHVTEPAGHRCAFSRWLFCGAGVVIVLIVLGGTWVHRWQHAYWQGVVESDLRAVAELKVSSIARWRKERLGDGVAIAQDAPLAKDVAEWMATGDRACEARLTKTFRGYRSAYGYCHVMLVDANARVLFSDPEYGYPLKAAGAALVPEVMKHQQAMLTGLHTGGTVDIPHVDVVAPVLAEKDGVTTAIAVVFLMKDAREYLFPLLQRWPAETRSAETLLVRKDDDHVLFLNNLRFRDDAALKFRVPLTSVLPAARAVCGERGVVESLDYRSVPVIAAIEPIPDSDWLMISKIDTDEAFERVHLHTQLVIGGTAGLLVLTILGTLLLWQQMETRHMRMARDAEAQRLSLVRHFEYLVKYANDIILLVNEDHRIIEANDRAIEAYGYSLEELRQKRMIDLVSSAMQPLYAERIGRVAEGVPLLCESEHQRKDGTTFPVEVSARLIEFEGHRCAQSIVRDITERKRAEAEQHRLERTLASIFEQSPLSMWISDEKGTFLRQNQACRELLRITDEDVVGVYNLFNDPITQAAGVVPLIEKVFREGVAVHFPLTYDISWLRSPRPEAAELLHLEVTIAPIKDEWGLVTNAVVQHIDMTQRVHAEENQRRTDRMLASIFEQSPLSMWLADNKGMFIRQNQACRNLFHIRDEEVAERYSLFTDPICIEAGVIDQIERVFREGEIARFHLTYDVSRIRQQPSESTILYLDVTISPIKDELGRVTNAIVQHVNLTDKVRAEAEQQQVERMLASIFEQSPLPMWISDAQGHFIRQNPAHRDLFGVPDEELVGQFNVLESETFHGQRLRPLVDSVYHDGAIARFTIVYDVARRTGVGIDITSPNVVWVDVTVSPVKDEHGVVVNAVYQTIDITEQKRAEEALHALNAELEQRVSERTAQLQAANKELESFAYSVSHDLRTPLRSLDGFSLALLDDFSDRLDDVGRDYLLRIRAAAQRMARLIDDLLRLSRLTRTDMTLGPVDLSRLAEGIVEELRQAEPGRSVTVTIQPDMVAQCDAELMRIVLANLLGNAWKFTGNLATAHIAFMAQQQDGQTVYLVRDDGAGFDMAYAEKLFGVFQRLHSGTEFPGTGIGLATVQRIISRHGGTIWAEAAVDCGATFFFTLSGRPTETLEQL